MKNYFSRPAGRLLLSVSAAAALSLDASAASILWVSDNTAEGSGFGLVPASAEAGFFNLLTGAGHVLTHYNSPNTGQMSAADVLTINSYDLVILGRSAASGAFTAANQAAQWNTEITAPVMSINGYLTRGGTGGGSRLGWFAGETVPDGIPAPVMALDLANPKTAYIFGNAAMTGNTTTGNYDEAIDRNTTQTTSAVGPGGVALATAAQGTATATIIAEWEAGVVVRGTDTLAGYRMYFAAGSREPNGGSVPQAGVENLTATGEGMFLRAVEIAANGGVVPEPSTFALLGLGLGGMIYAARRKKQ